MTSPTAVLLMRTPNQRECAPPSALHGMALNEAQLGGSDATCRLSHILFTAPVIMQLERARKACAPSWTDLNTGNAWILGYLTKLYELQSTGENYTITSYSLASSIQNLFWKCEPYRYFDGISCTGNGYIHASGEFRIRDPSDRNLNYLCNAVTSIKSRRLR